MERTAQVRTDFKNVLVRIPTRARVEGEEGGEIVQVTIPVALLTSALQETDLGKIAGPLANALGLDLGGGAVQMLVAKIPQTWTEIELPSDDLEGLQVELVDPEQVED